MIFGLQLILSVILFASAQNVRGNVISKPQVACYVGTWAAYRPGLGAYTIDNIDPFKCTHLLYSFMGITQEGEVRYTDPWLDLPDGGGKDTITKFNKLKEKNPDLKTIAAVGGWNEGSTNFSIVAASPDLRKKFAKSIHDFVKKHNFNGCDIDWEYPTQRNSLGNDDRNNFNLLLQEIKNAFAEDKLLLSVAVSATGPAASKYYNIPELVKVVDTIYIMAYDLALGSDAFTGFNAPLYPPQGQQNDLNVDAILKFWTSVAPVSILSLGVPFYGHTFTLADPNNNLPGAASAGPGPAGPFTQEAGTISYNELCIEWKTKTYNKVNDKVQGVPYAYLNTTWVTYDNPESIIAKAKLATKYGLTSVMAWSLESDDISGSCGTGVSPLLDALNKGINRVISAESQESQAAPESQEPQAAPEPKEPQGAPESQKHQSKAKKLKSKMKKVKKSFKKYLKSLRKLKSKF